MPDLHGEALIYGLIDTSNVVRRSGVRGRREIWLRIQRWRFLEDSCIRAPCAMRMLVHYRELQRVLKDLSGRNNCVSRMWVRVERDRIDVLHLGEVCVDNVLLVNERAPGVPRLLVDDVLGLVEVEGDSLAYRCSLVLKDGVRFRIRVVPYGATPPELTLEKVRESVAQMLAVIQRQSPHCDELRPHRSVTAYVGPEGLDHWSNSDGSEEAVSSDPVPLLRCAV